MNTPDLKTFLKDSKLKANKCDQCDYVSVKACNLKRHLKIHSGAKIHKCQECDFVSALAANLRTHMKTHFRETMKLLGQAI